jgi:hypothetical protein
MMRGLFLNVHKAECSIYESGLMIYNNLKNSEYYKLDYTEQLHDGMCLHPYDFYIFNYHFRDMGWLDTKVKLPGLKIAMVLEMEPDNPFVMMPDDFDIYCVLDPTFNPKCKDERIYAMPRALESSEVPPYVENKIPQIGTFGFLTRGKGYDKVVEAVGKEFKQASVRINIPFGTHIGFTQRIKMYLLERKIRRVTRRGIDVSITHDYLSKWELLKWCSENTLNVFLYDRDLPGLAATCDQCITSGRPLAVSDNPTFRHILKYLTPYPRSTLKGSILGSDLGILMMKEDWSKERFRERFEYILHENVGEKQQGCYTRLSSIPKIRYIMMRLSIAVYWRYRWIKHLLGFARNRK